MSHRVRNTIVVLVAWSIFLAVITAEERFTVEMGKSQRSAVNDEHMRVTHMPHATD